MPYGGRHSTNAGLLDGLDSTDFILAADLTTTVGDPGADTKVPSEQAVREALAAAGGGGSTGAPNLLINPEFAIDQRGAGAAREVANDGYAMDRWYLLVNSAGIDVERIAPGLHTSTHAGRVTTSFAGTRGGVAQIIESLTSRPYRGRTLQLQARVRHAGAVTLHWAILEWTGLADSVVSDVVNDWNSGTYTAGHFFASPNLVVTATGTQAVPANTWTALSGSGTVSTSCHNLIVFLWTEDPGAFDVTEADLFAGAAPRTWTPPDPADNLQRCQRFYEKSWDIDVAPGDAAAGFNGGIQFYSAANISGYLLGSFQYKTRKRVTPTITLYDGQGNIGKIYYYNTGHNQTGIVDGIGTAGARVMTDNTTPNKLGFAFHFTAESEL